MLLRRLRAEAEGTPLPELFRPSAADLRFRLGTSLADLRIPFVIGSALRAAMSTATIDAYLLAAQRHKASIPPGEYDRLVVIEGFDPTALRPLTFAPPASVTREGMRRAFVDALEGHAGIDAGLVASFFGTDRPGRALAVALHAVFAKAREEASRTDTREPTPYLVALMLRSAGEAAHALTRDAPVGEPLGRYLRAAVGVLVHGAAALALRETGLHRVAGLTPAPAGSAAQRDPHETRTAVLAVASLGVLPFLGARANVAQTGVSAYGLLLDSPPPRFEELVAKIAQGEEPEVVARDFALAAARERDLHRRLERAAAFAAVRETVRSLARALEGTRGAALAIPGEGGLERLVLGKDAVERVFASEPRRRDLARVAREHARVVQGDEARSLLEVLAHAAKEFRDEEPAAWLGTTDARLRAARSLVALAADTYVDRLAAGASSLLLERTGAETEAGEAGEYESGRLYFVSQEDRPLLKARVRPPQVGHLFCDIKDFTRRTAFLKESVIADFLQREFYAPILAAASGLDPGTRSPTAPRGVALNNLLGDAVSFSGDVVALMKLAGEIRDALKDYGRRLETEASQDAISARLRDLESQHRLRRDALERSLRELTARAPRAEQAIRDAMLVRAQEIRNELARLEALYQAETARAAGEKLEAGTFISFGAAPEVAHFDDPTFGHIKVAIAEKINESARGTARAGAVRAKVEAMLQRARRASGRELVLPFSVLVDAPPTVPISPEQGVAIAEHLARGNPEQAERIIAEVVRRAVAEPSRAGELYNAGTACSEEALRAWLEARANEYHVVRRTLPVTELHPTLRERFFFPHESLQFVACVSVATRALAELFVFQGKVLFRGFEATGGLGVYELVDPRSPFFTFVGMHHVAEAARPAAQAG